MSVFVQTGNTLNRFWNDILDAMPDMDTRAVYLLTFESALSGCLDRPIRDYDEYKEMHSAFPLPQDPNRIMPFNVYRSWVKAYTEIMRKENLLGLIRDTKPDIDGDDVFMRG